MLVISQLGSSTKFLGSRVTDRPGKKADNSPEVEAFEDLGFRDESKSKKYLRVNSEGLTKSSTLSADFKTCWQRDGGNHGC